MKLIDKGHTEAKLNMFGGVFTPCVLTILGVIMFLRFGEIIGHSGIWYGLVIVLCAKIITTLTALSLSAIATNTRTEAGGAYFMISRSLGPEFGGAIGIIFFIAQAISVAMYIIGFTEAFLGAFNGLTFPPQFVATIVNIICFICVFIGASWTIKLQYGILGILGVSLVAFIGGALQHGNMDNIHANLNPAWHFTTHDNTLISASPMMMFALFFPAVTGIMAGANMSGDLKNPSKAIPTGTLLAISVTALVYGALAIIISYSSTRDELLTDHLFMNRIAWGGAWFVTAGIFAATLSSALGSMMGAPRILQAFAKDNIFPGITFLSRGSGAQNEPRLATCLTFLIAQAAIMLGELNAIAPIITMAFMITYGLLNWAAFHEGFSHNPSWRPTFKINHWILSLIGAIACGGVMLLLNPIMAITATAGVLIIYYLISKREFEAEWGDVKRGVAFSHARRSLMQLRRTPVHPKNWRPIVLTMGGAASGRKHLARWGHWMTGQHGLQSLGLVIKGRPFELIQREESQRQVLRSMIEDERLAAFPAVVVAEDIDLGVLALIQCHGIGDLQPNTVLLGWPRTEERWPALAHMTRTIADMQRSILILKSDTHVQSIDIAPEGTIDIWWRGLANGPLMLLIGHMIRQNRAWRGRNIRIMRAVPEAAAVKDVKAHMQNLLDESRISAQIMVFISDNPLEAIQRTSKQSALTILGFAPPEATDINHGYDSKFVKALEKVGEGLPHVLYVWNAGGVHLDA